MTPAARFSVPLVMLAGLLAGSPAAGQRMDEDPTVQMIRGRTEVMRSAGSAGAGGETLRAVLALPVFYENRDFRPAWFDDGSLEPIDLLLSGIDDAWHHGLDPADYHRPVLGELAGRVRDGRGTAADTVDLDLLATDAFMVLGSHLLHGRVNAETIDPEWIANRRSARFEVVLAEALSAGSVRAALERLAPGQPRYRAMVDGLAELRAVAARGGWTRVPGGTKLELGSEGPRVAALTARLVESGDLTVGADRADVDPEHATFDASVESAVRRFQGRHGLDADGVVGPASLAALNVSAEERAATLITNLERWRWLPADLGRRHLEVNIAAFEVSVVEDGRTVRTHRAIVGRRYRETPIFSGTMTHLVFSPYWHVPPTIAAVDKFPAYQRDPSAIAAQRMTLLDQRTNEPVEPSSVDWSALDGREFNRRYRLRQDPGSHNALGSVKFMFPNRHSVYLHDTPGRELFDRTARDFSSGCIRVEDPLALAEFLLSAEGGWDRGRIDTAASAGSEQIARLSSGVPVHLLYWTAWADIEGTLHFRSDLYGRDAAVRRALDASAPGT